MGMMGSSDFEIEDSPEAVFQFMLDHGGSDGLPVIPPTAHRVRAMLDYVQRDASELVGYINPDAGAEEEEETGAIAEEEESPIAADEDEELGDGTFSTPDPRVPPLSSFTRTGSTFVSGSDGTSS